MGMLIYCLHDHLERAIKSVVEAYSLLLIVPLLIIFIGFVSSIISAILAALILVEIINALPLVKESKIEITVIACFAIGIGAGLTPLGEPLTTIVVSRLSGDPYHAGFGFLAGMLGIYIVTAVIFLGILGLFALKRRQTDETNLPCVVEREEVSDIIIRAGKVYLFIMALIFLGEGFQPLIINYVVLIPPEALYWVNMISAVLDNATLAAAEISPGTFLKPDYKRSHGASHIRGHADTGQHPKHYRGNKNRDHKPGVGPAGPSLGTCPDGRFLLYPLCPLSSWFCMSKEH